MVASMFRSMSLIVLIETLWNVKKYGFEEDDDASLVLIETLWNVKYNKRRLYPVMSRSINRNIVECKV